MRFNERKTKTMKTSHNRLLICLAAAVVSTALWLSAQAADTAAAKDDSSAAAAPCCAAPAPSLGRTIRLEFKLEHEEEAPRFPIVSAGGDFEITREEMGPEFEHHMSLHGEVLPTDNEDKVLVRFEISTGHAEVNEGHEGTSSATGSAIVTLGRELHVADLGDAPLNLTASEVK